MRPDPIRRALTLARGRAHLDRWGSSPRPPILGAAIGGGRDLQQNTAQAASDVRQATGGLIKTSWIVVDGVPAPTGSLTLQNLGALSSHMVETWYQSNPSGTPTAGGSVHAPPIPILPPNPYRGGYQWGQSLFAFFGYDPVIITSVPSVSTESHNVMTSKIELLDAAGAVLKWKQQVYDFSLLTTFGMSGDTLDWDQTTSAPTYDTNGPAAEFYGIRLTTDSVGTPDGGAPAVIIYYAPGEIL